MVSTIAIGFVGGGSSSASQRKYVWQVVTANVISLGLSKAKQRELMANITFYSSNTSGVLPHHDNLMVIIVQYSNSNIKQFLINIGNSRDILFWNKFQKL